MPMIAEILIAGLGTAALLAAQRANARHPTRPVRYRAPIDTLLHGLLPAVAMAPLAFLDPPDTLLYPGLAFAVGFCLDFDHPLFFRSFSIEVCSSRETRPPFHSLLFVAAVGAIAGLVAKEPGVGAVAAGAALLHLLFDATDDSGVPWLFPLRRRLVNLSYPLYVAAVAVVFASAAVVRLFGEG
jgi:membrane-bound metal-dependent hydrolase YbcI (DUF457 family)